VLRIFGQLAATATRLADQLANALRGACRPSVAGGVVADLTRSRAELIAENAFLRQRPIVASRGAKRPVFRGHERALLVLLASLLHRWRNALLLVKLETVLRWHRAGRVAGPKCVGRPRDAETATVTYNVLGASVVTATANQFGEIRLAWAGLNPIDRHLLEERTGRLPIGEFNAAREPEVQNVLGRFVLASGQFGGCHGSWDRRIFATVLTLDLTFVAVRGALSALLAYPSPWREDHGARTTISKGSKLVTFTSVSNHGRARRSGM
jgi:hypothetical protein